MPPTPSIAFSWNGLPYYAARQIKVAIDRLGCACIVVGSRPSVPVVGMEAVLGCAISWIANDKPASWRELGHAVPDVYIQSGWSYPAFSALGLEVKANGGRVIGLSDANWRGDFRQVVLGPVGFRLLHRGAFDAMIVPGQQGSRLMSWFGMEAGRVRHGMLGADPDLFGGGPALATRPKTFLFVGQFIYRKDVLGLCRAFIRFCDRHDDWTLRLCGSGEQRSEIPAHSRIIVEEFVQPADLARRFHQARFFVLPSRVEAWGLVVHEAALSGCGLVLSRQIGAGDDLATSTNAVRFEAGDDDAILAALEEAASFDDARLAAAEATSRALASQFGPDRFAREVCELVAQFTAGAVVGRRTAVGA